VLSLGFDCQAQYQIRRYMRSIGSDGQVGLGSPTTVFSWQVTPIEGLLLYLRRDFAGLFERDDLYVGPYGITNRLADTLHLHEFPAQSAEGLAAHYAVARERHDRLCARTRQLIADDEPTLLVFDSGMTPLEGGKAAELRERLQHYNPNKALGLLCTTSVRDPGRDWRGDGRAWCKALATQLRPPNLLAQAAWLLRRPTQAGRGELSPS
jgi:hypothetical protein